MTGLKLLILFGVLYIPLAMAEHEATTPARQTETKWVPPIGEMPYLAIISYGFETDDAIKPITEDLKTLADCGITPKIHLDNVAPSKLPGELRKNSVPKNALYVVTAHGSGTCSPYRIETKRGVESTSGDDFVRMLEGQSPDANIWLDTCHSGSCRAGTRVGVACQMDEDSYSGAGWPDITRLVCDGYRGDCSLWKEWDANGDGRISSTELNAFLHRRATTAEVESRVTAKTLEGAEALFATYSSNCQGQARWIEPPKHFWMLSSDELYDASGKRARDPQYVDGILMRGRPQLKEVPWASTSEPVAELSHVDAAAGAEIWLSRRYPDWPASCGTTASGLTRRNCRLADRAVEGRAGCRSPRGGYGGITSPTTFQPDSRGFELTANRCAEARSRRLPQTGLQIRATLE